MSDTEFKYDLLFELSSDLLCIAGYDGYFKKVNAAVSQLLGYSMEELYARPINDFIHEGDRDKTANVRKELTRSKPLLNFENRYITKSGEVVWLSWTSHPVESEQVIFAIAKNITHKKTQEAERNALLANLTQINKDLKQLTYTTSHDLRSPVNNLLSIINLIDISKVNDSETRKLLGILKLSGNKLKQTLNDYVDVIIEKHDMHARREEVDLHQCLSSVVESLGSLIQVSNTTLQVDFSKLDKIIFNRACMESVFLNLISNAIKYARPDRAPVISIYAEKRDGANRLIITDNGLGFDMEKIGDKIFGLHQKFHSHADSKGIGLYLVHSHITTFGGDISVESKVNEGSKFTISLYD